MWAKKIILTFVVSLMVFCVPAQTKSYEEAMKKNLKVLETSNDLEGFKRAALGFEKIAKEEKSDWLSYYYAGVCNTLIAFEKKGKEIDTWCDKAEAYTKKADSLNTKSSEILVLKSMIACARIGVHPAQRGQKYAAQANKLWKEALNLDARNPRAYLQKATVIYYTPEVFGGGAKKAKVHFDTALEKFKEYKPLSSIDPDWGKQRAEKLLKECAAKLK